MPAFPRTVLPRGASWPTMPTGLVSVANSGKVQRRTTTQVGRAWTESYGPYLRSSAVFRNWLALVSQYYREMTTLTVYHVSMKDPLGAPSGTPLVNGASQTGSSLITDGWPNATLVLRAGDIIRVAGVSPVLEITADATTNGSGQVTLGISPAIYTGGSPADNAVITTNQTPGAVLYNAFIESLDFPGGDAAEFYDGLTLRFRELV